MTFRITFLILLVAQLTLGSQSKRLLCALDSQCDDNNPCTYDSCLLNICIYSYAFSGTPCEDGLFCTSGDTCNGGGTCVAGTQPTCSGQCNSHCDENANSCFSPNGTSCDDGLWCNGQDFCNGHGNCTVHSGNPCQNSTGSCTTTTCSESKHCFLPAGTPCDNDGNQCTSDTCNSQGSCVHASKNGTACNDGFSCTLNDVCSGTECVGSWNSTCSCVQNSDCNDHNSCTDDTCFNGDCIHTPVDGRSCEDGDWCNGHEVCMSGVCQAGTPPCDTSNPCNGTCNSAAQTCHAPINTACDDNIFCNGNDFCNGLGLCVASEVSPCGGECQNTCNETLRVCHDPVGTSCDDGLFCNGLDSCDGSGHCMPSGVDPCDGLPECQNKCDEDLNSCVNTTTVECSGDFCGGAIYMCLSGMCTAVGERCNTSQTCDAENLMCVSINSTTSSSTTGSTELPSHSPSSDPTTTSSKSGSSFVVIGAGAGGGAALIGGICLAGVCVAKAKRKKNEENKPTDGGSEEKGIPDTGFYADVSGGVSNQDFLWSSQISGVIITNLIGSGNFGEVYKGVWQKEKEKSAVEVALKTLKDEEQFTEFVEEASMLSQLDHRNIVKYFGVFVQKEEKYIVTEFMNRGSLIDLLHSAKFNQKDRKEMALDAAKGMAYLHSKSVIHRDLACRNILVDFSQGSYTVKISDFGMARAIERYYYSRSNQIPIRWSAPEVLCYKKYSQPSDVWSFGICMWEIYSNGEEPYMGFSNQEVVNIVQQGHRLSKPAGCPDAIYSIMRMCWNEEKHERPTFEELVTLISKADTTKITELPRTQSTTKAVLNKFMEAAMHHIAVEKPVTIFEDDSLPPSYGADSSIPMNEM